MPVSFKEEQFPNGDIEYHTNWNATCYTIDKIYGVTELIKELALNGFGAEIFKSIQSNEFVPLYDLI